MFSTLRIRLGISGAITVIALLLVPASALAVEHPLLGNFGAAAEPTFSQAAGMTVDPDTGDLLVITREEVSGEHVGTLHRYKPDGTPDDFSALSSSNVIDGHAGEADATPSGVILSTEAGDLREAEVAVAPPGAAGGTAGDIYVTNAFKGVIDIFSSTGAFVAERSVSSFPCGVAVDPAGNVFVGSYEGEKEGISKLIPSEPGHFTESAKSPYKLATPTTHPCQVAAGTGFVYAAAFDEAISKIFSEGTEEGKTQYVFSAKLNIELALDPTSGHLYTAVQGQGVTEYDVSGATEATEVSETFAATGPEGVAVSAISGILFIAPGHVGPGQKVEEFGPSFPKLSVNPGTGGSVECKVGAGAFAPCVAGTAYETGKVVKLKAVPAANHSFSGWSEFTGSASVTTPCTGNVTECEVKMFRNVTGNASFAVITHTLNVSVTGAGEVECKVGVAAFAPCVAGESYEQGKVVKLRAAPEAHHVFSGWSSFIGSGSVAKPCSGTATECEVKMSADVTGSASFALESHALSIATAGTGAGSVSCNSAACAASYPHGTTLTLTASAAADSSFAGWSGAGCSGTASCQLTIEADTSVTASFSKLPDVKPPPGPTPQTIHCVVPKLAKKTLAKAKAALKAAHCALGKVAKLKKAKGTLLVKSSQPSAGTSLPEGAKVNLKLAPKPKGGRH